MKSNQLTKNQVAGIVKNELNLNNSYLYSILLVLIVQILLSLFQPSFILAINLICCIITGIILFLIFKENNSKIKELESKYEEK